MAETTTVKIRTATKDRVERYKVYPRETIDDVIVRLLENTDMLGMVVSPPGANGVEEGPNGQS